MVDLLLFGGGDKSTGDDGSGDPSKSKNIRQARIINFDAFFKKTCYTVSVLNISDGSADNLEGRHRACGAVLPGGGPGIICRYRPGIRLLPLLFLRLFMGNESCR